MIDKNVLELLLLLSHFIYLLVHLSLHIRHMLSTKFNIHRDTARTHRCTVGLVFLYLRVHVIVYFSLYWPVHGMLLVQGVLRLCSRGVNGSLKAYSHVQSNSFFQSYLLITVGAPNRNLQM